MSPKLYDPAKVVRKRTYQKALKAVNLLRKVDGHAPLARLPKGKARSTCECPVARALRPLGVASVRAGTIDFEIREVQVPIPFGKPVKVEVAPCTLTTHHGPADHRAAVRAITTFISEFDKRVPVEDFFAEVYDF